MQGKYHSKDGAKKFVGTADLKKTACGPYGRIESSNVYLYNVNPSLLNPVISKDIII